MFNKVMNKLFASDAVKEKAAIDHAEPTAASLQTPLNTPLVEKQTEEAKVVHQRPPVIARNKALTQHEIKAQYASDPSFADRLPWVEYLRESQCFLLDDGVSVGVAADIDPIATEGQSAETLQALRDQIEDAFQDTLPEYDKNPWVLQLFVRDDANYIEEVDHLKAYNKVSSDFSYEWLGVMGKHWKGVSKKDGLFFDDVVTKAPWRGQRRKVRLVLYRWLGNDTKRVKGNVVTPEDEANIVYDRLVGALTNTGLRVTRMGGTAFHRWMMTRFNPAPAVMPDDPQAFYDLCRYEETETVQENELAVPLDFTESMLYSRPRADAEKGNWYFDQQPQRCIVVEGLRKKPHIGHLTGEVKRSDGKAGVMMDILPEGCEMVLTLVAIAQEPLEDHITKLSEKAHGRSVLASNVRKDCETARQYLGQQHKMYQSALVFYVQAKDDASLQSATRQLSTVLLQAQLQLVEPDDEVAPLNTYLRWLPMAFEPQKDRQNWYTSYNYVQHIASLSPLFGRGRGTGNQGFSFFNRGGESFSFDPLSLEDRAKNAHMLIFGPTGAGKSATLTAMFSQVMATYRPRLFVIEVGNSFGLAADYYKQQGLTVNKVKLAPNQGVTLAPFSEAVRLVSDKSALSVKKQRDLDEQTQGDLEKVSSIDELMQDDTQDEERDVLGEMELTARLMITGGDPTEEKTFRRADKSAVRNAIFSAGEYAVEHNCQCLTEHVRDAFKRMANDDTIPDSRQSRFYEMAEAIDLFCSGFEGEVFNTEGDVWPECDVTVIDLAHFSREGYDAQLALAVISVTNTIINLAEREQYSERPIIQAIDESHIVTKNPLLSPFFVKVGKMGRKLGYWLWFATQNLEDFPKEAAAILSMVEWFVCLMMTPKEVKELSRFRKLTPDQEELMLSTQKKHHKYTEGVVLSDRIEALFRVVPPSLYLSIAGTEKAEKAARKVIMDADHCSELDAAIKVAYQLDVARGLIDEGKESV